MKPNLSATQLESYCRCGEQYRRRYLEKEIQPPGIALMKGKGFHKGAETNMRQKIESHEDLSPRDIVEAAVDGFEQETRGGYTLSEEEASIGADKVIGKAKDDTAAMAFLHAEEQAPEYQPVIVEKKVRLVLPNSPRDLLGVVDLADDQSRVVDFKTAARKKPQSDADNSIQLTVYAAAFHADQGQPPTSLRLDSAVRTAANKTYRDVLETQRGAADFAALAARINAVSAAIDAGSFPPATPGAWWCSDRFCGYWRTCPYVNSERKAKA